MNEGRVSPIPREARPYQGQRAGVVTRVIANAIDAGVVLVLLVGAYLGWNALVFVLDPRGFGFTGASALFCVTAGLVTFVLYLSAAWATVGRTYGCHVMGLRVVTRRGRRLRPLAALIRATACVFFPIGLLWCAVNRTRGSLQDIVLRTAVIYDWNPRSDTVDVQP